MEKQTLAAEEEQQQEDGGGESSLDLFAADMWSVGVVVYFLMCGRVPCSGTTVKQVMRRVQAGEFDVSPSAFTAASAEAMDLVASLLAFDPAARPSAAEARLHPFLAGDGAGATSSAEGAAPATTTHIYTTQLGAAAGLLAPAAPGAAMKGPVAAPGPRMRPSAVYSAEIRLAGPLALLALAQQPAAMAIAA